MKNVHILPTEHTSRLYYNRNDKSWQLCEFPKYHTDIKSTHNIYITNDEEIKEGDWMIRGNEQPIKVTKDFFWDFGVRYYKIILTTDQDLIKDGVQAIDDEFLEWFVAKANDSGKPIDIVKTERFYSMTQSSYLGIEYKIILPKEEQTKCYCGHTTTCDCGPEELEITQLEILETPMPIYKQEPLEEAAERKFENIGDRLIFEDGAKWRQERSYSEKEVYDLIHKRDIFWTKYKNTYSQDYISTKDWFEQFKKKKDYDTK